jgi:serine phosphatase RsbU (regulator of sigma subunit)
VRDTFEFDALSTDINSTVDRLKEYISEAAARYDAELAVAKEIQTSALPNIFPPFPDRYEFELFAGMEAAKEVGGDFYDFYMIGQDTLGFLIADVSGKSIPGAMFMMRGKSVIKSLAESGMPPAEVFSAANEKLCEGNEAELFITA